MEDSTGAASRGAGLQSRFQAFKAQRHRLGRACEKAAARVVDDAGAPVRVLACVKNGNSCVLIRRVVACMGGQRVKRLDDATPGQGFCARMLWTQYATKDAMAHVHAAEGGKRTPSLVLFNHITPPRRVRSLTDKASLLALVSAAGIASAMPQTFDAAKPDQCASLLNLLRMEQASGGEPSWWLLKRPRGSQGKSIALVQGDAALIAWLAPLADKTEVDGKRCGSETADGGGDTTTKLQGAATCADSRVNSGGGAGGAAGAGSGILAGSCRDAGIGAGAGACVGGSDGAGAETDAVVGSSRGGPDAVPHSDSTMSAAQSQAHTAWIVQRYLAHPLLVKRGAASFKFDVRVFVLVPRVNPTLALYRDGYFRVCIEPYQPPTPHTTTAGCSTVESMPGIAHLTHTCGPLHRHLTNLSLQREHPSFTETKEHLAL